MKEYYKNRVPWINRIYWLLVGYKVGCFNEVVQVLFTMKELRTNDIRLSARYPATEAGDATFQHECIIVMV